MKKIFRIATVPMSLNILLKGQLAYLDKSYGITAISGAGKDLDEVAQREGVHTHAIRMERQIAPLSDLVSLVRLYRYFRKEKPDIIHSLTPKAGLLSMVAGRMAGVPIRMHTFTGLIFPYKKGMMQKILIAMDKLLCYCATQIYPEGQGVKADLIKFRITGKPLTVLANGNINGVDVDFFNRNSVQPEFLAALRAEYKIRQEDRVFIFVGRLVRDKGINELVSAFVKLCQDVPATSRPKLLLVGPYEQELDPLLPETLAAIRDSPDIITTGFQTDVRPWMAMAELLVFPSYREGFPNVVLQAGAMGLNGIVTDISGCNEIVTDGANGWIVPVADAAGLYDRMRWCLEHPGQSLAMGGNAREEVTERFRQATVWEALTCEYDRLLTGLEKNNGASE